MLKAVLLAGLLANFPPSLGHYQFPKFVNNGTVSKKWEFVRRPPVYPIDAPEDLDLRFLDDVYSTDIRCGEGALESSPETGVAKVKAGSEIGFRMFDNEKLYHYGPLGFWLSKAPGDVRKYDGSGYWFKVHEWGLEWDGNAPYRFDRLKWVTHNEQQWTFKLPETIPPGQYLLRIEHVQPQPFIDGPASYVNCAQIEVEGPGGGTPRPLKKIPNPSMLFDEGSWLDYLYWDALATEEQVREYKPFEGEVWSG